MLERILFGGVLRSLENLLYINKMEHILIFASPECVMKIAQSWW